MIEREPVTVILSRMGWIRAVKGHQPLDAEVKFRDGDGPFLALHAETTDKLMVFGANGRFYTVPANTLPGGRGLGEPLRISAEHGEGMDDLYRALVPLSDRIEAERPSPVAAETDIDISDEDAESGAGAEDWRPSAARPLQLAVIGRPNAGKSTLINKIIGEDRLLTGPEAGITRDSISVATTFMGTPMRIFDTAGMRKRAKVTDKVEKLSVADGLRAVRFAEVVVVLQHGVAGAGLVGLQQDGLVSDHDAGAADVGLLQRLEDLGTGRRGQVARGGLGLVGDLHGDLVLAGGDALSVAVLVHDLAGEGLVDGGNDGHDIGDGREAVKLAHGWFSKRMVPHRYSRAPSALQPQRCQERWFGE